MADPMQVRFFTEREPSEQLARTLETQALIGHSLQRLGAPASVLEASDRLIGEIGRWREGMEAARKIDDAMHGRPASSGGS